VISKVLAWLSRSNSDRGKIAERLMESAVIEPADVFDDGELELGSGAPDAVGDQLGLEAVNERLGSVRGSV
jgi:hypothetical protein